MSLFSELRRRNVHRMAALYMAAAWLVMQVVDVVEGKLPLPDWMGSAVLAVLAVGLPIALVISWFYELTPEGISLDTDDLTATPAVGFAGRRVDFVIIAVLAAALLVFAYDKWWLPEAPERSVAVLPFANMSADEDSAYFSDGLADTLLHMLAQVPDLRVPARTSSFQFRDRAMDIGEIGRQLNVSSVLEGSVQKSGDKIRVTAQLIDVSNGYHLWSGNFDRDLDDVFAIQDEIANEVVSALKVSLLGESAESLTRDHTDNLGAYTEYLLAVRDLNITSSDNLTSAVSHLQEAIRLDPDYARAYSTLGRAYLDMTNWGAMSRDQAVAAARKVASRALDIDPASSEALAVFGYAAMSDRGSTRDLTLAGELLTKAIEIGPNDVVALGFYAHYLESVARPEEAEAVYREMIHLDPLSENAHVGLAITLIAQMQYDEASDVIANFKVIQPDSTGADLMFVIDRNRGNLAASITAMMDAIALDPDDTDPERQFLIGRMYLRLDMPAEAGRWFDRAIEIDAQHPVSRAASLWLDYYLQQNEQESFRLARELLAERVDGRHGSRVIALTILTDYGAETGRHDLVLDTLDNLYPHLFDDPPHDLDKNLGGTFFVGLALLRSGDTDRGLHLLQYRDELTAPYREAYSMGRLSVATPLLVGDKDGALDRLAELAKYPHTSARRLFLERSSLYDPLRQEPAFIALLDEYHKNAEKQRQILQAMSQDSSGQ